MNLKKGPIDLHGSGPVPDSPPVRALNEQAFLLGEGSRKLHGTLRLSGSFGAITQMPPSVGQGGVAQWIIGIRTYSLDQQITGTNKIEGPELCLALRIQENSSLVGGK